ncbi:MAG: recombinase family protein [Pseudomarimonas sp.]
MTALAYSYIRFSSPEQARGDSLRRQQEAAKAYCERNGLTLVDNHQDLGTSAFKGKNKTDGALGKFLELAESGAIPKGSRLIVESLDRLSRDRVLSALTLLQRIMSAGITVVTLIDGERTYSHETSDYLSLMMALATMQRAHEESATKSARSRSTWARKRKDANTNRLMTTNVPEWLEVRDGVICERPDRVAALRKMFTWVMDERLGVRAVAKRLDMEGIRPWGKAKHWPSSTVQKYIVGRAALGEFQPMIADSQTGKLVASGDPVAGYFPAVIDADTFHAVQALRQPLSRPVPGPKGGLRLLSRLLRCGGCGSGMVFYGVRRGQPAACYRCRRFCGFRAWNAQFVDDLVLHAVGNNTLGPLLSFDSDKRLAEIAKEIASIDGQEASMGSAIANLLTALEHGASAAVSAQLRGREQDREQLRKVRAALVDEQALLRTKPGGSPAEIKERIAQLLALRESAPESFVARAGALLRDYLECIELYAAPKPKNEPDCIDAKDDAKDKETLFFGSVRIDSKDKRTLYFQVSSDNPKDREGLWMLAEHEGIIENDGCLTVNR